MVISGMLNGHPLTEYRKSRGLSRDALAGLLGVSGPTVWRWEKGLRNIDRELLPKVARETGIPARTLRPDLAELMEAAE